MELFAIVWLFALVVLVVRGLLRLADWLSDSTLYVVPLACALFVVLAFLALLADGAGLISLFGSDSDLPHA